MDRAALARAAVAAVAYSVAVFAIGFVLGTVRVLLLAPRFGELVSVCLELPVMLAASWIVCRALVVRLHVSRHSAPRIVMGVGAFALLMAVEFGLAAVAFGRGPGEQLAALRALPAALGLAAQAAFACIPWVMARHQRGA